MSDRPSAQELISAFVHPPRLVAISRRVTSDEVVDVLSHVELWPWRVVVRGLRAGPPPAPEPSPPAETPPGGPSGGVITAVVISGDGRWADDVRRLGAWELTDDVGTAYRTSSASGGGVGTLWEDYSIQFEPGVPADATALVLHTADGVEIDVGLGQ